AEERRDCVTRSNGGADARSQGHFRDRHEEATVGNVMYGVHTPRFDQSTDEIAVALFALKIDGRCRAFFAALDFTQIQRLSEMVLRFADDEDGIVLALECDARHAMQVFDQSY